MVYQINTNISKQKIEELLESLTEDELDDFEDIHMEVYDIDYDNSSKSFLIIDRKSMYKIIHFLRKKNITFIYFDITDQIINGRFLFTDKEFQSKINKFISDNLTLDIVLDKINKIGISGISDIDKKFLDNY